jgi:hypothetical protein
LKGFGGHSNEEEVPIISALIGTNLLLSCKVARWYVFKQKIQIWVNFGGPWIEKGGVFYGHLEYIMAFSGRLVYFTPFWYIK